MFKSIIISKKVLFMTLFIMLSFCFLATFLISTLPGSSSAAQSQGRYEIGERVTDPAGSLWEYKGNFRIELGQLTKDLKLLSVIICGVEKPVYFIHAESIPNVVIGDRFKLIVPSAELSNLILSTPGLRLEDNGKENVITADPPSFIPGSRGGTLCCMFIGGDD